jgi:hypothetical protein
MMSVRRGAVRQHAGIVPDVPGAAAILLTHRQQMVDLLHIGMANLPCIG